MKAEYSIRYAKKKKTNTPLIILSGALFAIFFLVLAFTGGFKNIPFLGGGPNVIVTPTPTPNSTDPTAVDPKTLCKNFNDKPQDALSNGKVNKKWFLLGDEIPQADQNMIFTFSKDRNFKYYFESDTPEIKYTVLKETSPSQSESVAEGVMPYDTASKKYSLKFPVYSYQPGKYYISLSAQTICGESKSSQFYFNVSYPLYIAWTLDWEGYDVKQQNMIDLDADANKYKIPLTHFWNPRIYVTSTVSKTRQDEMTKWVLDRKAKNNDQIALHLHMFPDMVKAAGVEPQTTPAWGWYSNDGYDILVSGYDANKMDIILNWAKKKFQEKGLGNPTAFRAGGWFANLTTLKALQDSGFQYDSSGRTSYKLGKNNVQTFWTLKSSTQPYKPNVSNQNSAAAPTLNLWEFPNNGGDSEGFTTDQMIQRFYDNFDKTPLKSKKMITYLSHPQWYDTGQNRMVPLWNEIDKFSYIDDSGPVVYTTLDNAYQIWSQK